MAMMAGQNQQNYTATSQYFWNQIGKYTLMHCRTELFLNHWQGTWRSCKHRNL